MTTASKSRRQRPLLLGAAAALMAFVATPAMAAGITLCAEPYLQSLPSIGSVPMWGYRQVADAAACATNIGSGTASPGPVITVAPADTTLDITLVNNLKVPTSIVLAGQALPADAGVAMGPVHALDLIGPSCAPATDPMRCRVRSFTGETDPGATKVYNFTNLKPGSFLYQSGTHQQVQVQMGLFGLMRHDAGTAGQLVTGVAYDADTAVVLSEIDPDQHALIASTLGSATPSTWQSGGNSTLNYAPRFFLVNGKVFDSANPAASDLAVTAGAGGRIVLRLANAGLMSRSLVLNTGTWKLLTEDGNAYAAPLEQASALLPAGKTSDALLISTAPPDGSSHSRVALFDRRGGTSNGDGTLMGGQVVRVAQAGPPVPFIASIANQVANEGTTFSLQVLGSNITSYALTTFPTAMTINAASGLISWPVPTGTTPPTNEPVTVTGAGPLLPPASQSFSIRINHAPVAANSSTSVAHGSVTVAAPGALAGTTDPDGDTAFTAVQSGAVSSGTLTLNPDGSYSWTGPQPATGSSAVSFSFAARDPYGLNSTPKTVTLNVAANVPPVAVNDAYTITLARVPVLNTPQLITNALQIAAMTKPVSTLTGNDTDADGTVNAATIARIVPVPPLTGTISARRINPTSPAGCTTNCATIAPGPLQTQASVTMNTNGTFTLVPHALATVPIVGTYEFRYTVRDDQNALSNQAVVRVTVQ